MQTMNGGQKQLEKEFSIANCSQSALICNQISDFNCHWEAISSFIFGEIFSKYLGAERENLKYTQNWENIKKTIFCLGMTPLYQGIHSQGKSVKKFFFKEIFFQGQGIVREFCY